VYNDPTLGKFNHDYSQNTSHDAFNRIARDAPAVKQYTTSGEQS